MRLDDQFNHFANRAVAARTRSHEMGGDGAVREVIELIVKAQGKWTAASRDAKA